jgi:hypothetical protein
MLRLFKRVAWLGMLAAGLPAAQAFTPAGPPPPNEPWQVSDLGYMLPGDIVTPKNIGEEYRRNIPVVYYAFDDNFSGYFGTRGEAAVDQAFQILNNLQPVSCYSSNLTEVPLEAQRFNQTAGALNLLDIKSAVLGLLVEQLGLADPIRYTWTIHDRTAGANCPIGNQYLVVKRNLAIVPSDLDQLQYSSYVNGVLYSYYIHDYCANPPYGAPMSEAIEIPVDVTINASRYAPIASTLQGFFAPGGFYNGLTRDDVAGLRYLLRAGNVNWEDNPTNSIVLVTNAGSLQYLSTSNLNLLAAQSLTNDDAGLLALYPGLAIAPNSTVPFFTNVVTTNINWYYTNDVWGSPGMFTLKATTNYDTNVMLVYRRQFANVITNTCTSQTLVTVIDTNVYFPPNGMAGYFTTNINTAYMWTNVPTCDYYLMPTNACGVQFLSNILTKAIGITNSLVVTNTPTNAISGSYLLGRTYIYNWNQQFLAFNAPQCVTNEPGLRRGVEKITFVKTSYDSYSGRYYAPQTNFFSMTTVTNSTNWVQTFERIATAPDIIFTAVDALPGPAAPLLWNDVARNIHFSSANSPGNGLAGPGVIDPQTVITFNKSGPIFYNVVTNLINGNWFMDERTSGQQFLWASYDDSTNAPVVFPNGTSIQEVESQMLMQVTSVTLPPAHVNTGYITQLTGTGGAPPYTWYLADDSQTLPAGLTLTSDGRLSGTPRTAGIASFFVQMTDTQGGFTVWQVTLTVLP